MEVVEFALNRDHQLGGLMNPHLKCGDPAVDLAAERCD
jgi:hypothetical protein